MALTDRLREVKREEMTASQMNSQQEIIELLKETNELNQIMQSYIRVHMNEDTLKRVTMDAELDSMKKTSEEIQTNLLEISTEIQKKMVLIFQRLEGTQKAYADNLQQVINDSKNEISENNRKTLNRMTEIESLLKKSMSTVEENNQKTVNALKTEVLATVVEVRKGILMNGWLNLAKQGVATAVCFVPVFLFIRFLLGLMNIKM